MIETREAQYQSAVELSNRQGLTTLGLTSNISWYDDPKRLTFMLARYKFVAKMFSGMRRVLEVGCGDAFGTRVVQQEVGSVTAVDFDPIFIEDARRRMDARWQFECRVHDMTEGPVDGTFDGAFALDVLEHIPADRESKFVANTIQSMSPTGSLIIGCPSSESQVYASPRSKAGHVNCKDANALKNLFARSFHSVFIFSMNDEVVHTGFYPMAQYLLALCCNVKRREEKCAGPEAICSFVDERNRHADLSQEDN